MGCRSRANSDFGVGGRLEVEGKQRLWGWGRGWKRVGNVRGLKSWGGEGVVFGNVRFLWGYQRRFFSGVLKLWGYLRGDLSGIG